MKWYWLMVPLPFIFGLLIAAVLNNDPTLNPLLYLRVSLSVVVWVGGLLISLFSGGLLLWLWRDHHYRNELQTQQTETAEDRRRFLQRLDHELKNPLTAMRAGLANFANAPTPTDRQSAMQTVETQILRLSRLTADLRKIAELETRPLERGPIDLAELLTEVVNFTRDKPETTTRRLSLSLPRAPWPLSTIPGDWDLIYLGVYNLLDNAIKYSRAGDTIEVRAREDGSWVVIEVADTGPGIEEGELPHVWEELYRAQAARGIPGSGLGLPLVKAIAERHGGYVSLDSRIGKGTVVAMHLPIQ